MRIRTHAVGVVAAVVLAIGLSSVPAHATVHEIVAQWCSGQDELNPPGISGGSRADNFARPLNAIGVINVTVDQSLGIILISFNYDHQAVKVQSSGEFEVIGMMGDLVVLLDVPEPDPDFPAFQRCPRLAE